MFVDKNNPQLARLVEAFSISSRDYSIIRGASKTLSVSGVQLSSRHQPEQEAEVQASNILESDNLYIYGLGLGYLCEALLRRKNLKALNIKILNLRLFSLILRFRDQTKWLKDNRVIISLASADPSIFGPFFAFPPDLLLADESSHKIRNILSSEIGNQVALKQFNPDEPSIVERIQENYVYLEKDKDIDLLSGIAKGNSSVVIGAGPSLTTCISELKSLYNKKNRPVFICVATATKLLVDAKIIPDYVVIIDKDTRLPHPLISNFSNMWKSKLIYFPLVFPKILGEWEGERYAAYSASPMYDKAKVLYPKGSLFSGGSVIHVATDLASKIGCRSITFYGADFSFTCNETHAGHTEGVVPMYHDTAKPGESNRWLKNGYGNMVPTLDSFIAYVLELERYIKDNSHIKFWNSSKLGAFIEGCDFIGDNQCKKL
ncbi:MAG: 6-hydroxymethylpterin diphosphokinase MptE-like protein [Pseudomonadota bacterium]|nr:6-hydroxymethylpterin diphosphokinase MptE-like protein [Pseudomonadota bacterium]